MKLPACQQEPGLWALMGFQLIIGSILKSFFSERLRKTQAPDTFLLSEVKSSKMSIFRCACFSESRYVSQCESQCQQVAFEACNTLSVKIDTITISMFQCKKYEISNPSSVLYETYFIGNNNFQDIFLMMLSCKQFA